MSQALKDKPIKLVLKEGKDASYRDLILSCLDQIPPGNGLKRKDFRDRDRIEDAMNSAKNGTLKFEDNDAENLKRIVDEMQWGIRHRDISKFLDDVEAMKSDKK